MVSHSLQTIMTLQNVYKWQYILFEESELVFTLDNKAIPRWAPLTAILPMGRIVPTDFERMRELIQPTSPNSFTSNSYYISYSHRSKKFYSENIDIIGEIIKINLPGQTWWSGRSVIRTGGIETSDNAVLRRLITNKLFFFILETFMDTLKVQEHIFNDILMLCRLRKWMGRIRPTGSLRVNCSSAQIHPVTQSAPRSFSISSAFRGCTLKWSGKSQMRA